MEGRALSWVSTQFSHLFQSPSIGILWSWEAPVIDFLNRWASRLAAVMAVVRLGFASACMAAAGNQYQPRRSLPAALIPKENAVGFASIALTKNQSRGRKSSHSLGHPKVSRCVETPLRLASWWGLSLCLWLHCPRAALSRASPAPFLWASTSSLSRGPGWGNQF